MKKAVLFIAALVFFCSFGFAQASVGAWGRGIVSVAGGGDDILMSEHASWGWNTRVGMTISGTSDNVGFQADFNVDGAGVGAGDQQKIWVKPIDMLTITIGRSFDDTLRGNAVFGAWDWLRYDVIDGEDAIFGRVGITGQSNIEIALAPAEGAYIFAATNQILGGDAEILAQAAMAYAQIGAGYTIEGIGQIRLQYVGETSYRAASSGYIEGAFKLTMVEGLVVDLGGKYWMECPDQTSNMAKAALYISYSMDALTIHAYGDLMMYDEDTHVGDDLGLGFALGVDYSLEGGIGINADVRYANDIKSGYNDGTISGMVGVTMGFSNGLIGIGVEITTGNFVSGDNPMVAKPAPEDMAFAIPIRLEYWF